MGQQLAFNLARVGTSPLDKNSSPQRLLLLLLQPATWASFQSGHLSFLGTSHLQVRKLNTIKPFERCKS